MGLKKPDENQNFPSKTNFKTRFKKTLKQIGDTIFPQKGIPIILSVFLQKLLGILS